MGGQEPEDEGEECEEDEEGQQQYGEGHMVGHVDELHLGGQVTFIANINNRPDRFLGSKTG